VPQNELLLRSPMAERKVKVQAGPQWTVKSETGKKIVREAQRERMGLAATQSMQEQMSSQTMKAPSRVSKYKGAPEGFDPATPKTSDYPIPGKKSGEQLQSTYRMWAGTQGAEKESHRKAYWKTVGKRGMPEGSQAPCARGGCANAVSWSAPDVTCPTCTSHEIGLQKAKSASVKRGFDYPRD